MCLKLLWYHWSPVLIVSLLVWIILHIFTKPIKTSKVCTMLSVTPQGHSYSDWSSSLNKQYWVHDCSSSAAPLHEPQHAPGTAVHRHAARPLSQTWPDLLLRPGLVPLAAGFAGQLVHFRISARWVALSQKCQCCIFEAGSILPGAIYNWSWCLVELCFNPIFARTDLNCDTTKLLSFRRFVQYCWAYRNFPFQRVTVNNLITQNLTKKTRINVRISQFQFKE